MLKIHKNVKDFDIDVANIYDWFLDNKLSFDFGEDKNKFFVFTSKYKIQKISKLDIIYNNQQGSWETFEFDLIPYSWNLKKKLKFLHRKNKCSTPNLRLYKGKINVQHQIYVSQEK